MCFLLIVRVCTPQVPTGSVFRSPLKDVSLFAEVHSRKRFPRFVGACALCRSPCLANELRGTPAVDIAHCTASQPSESRSVPKRTLLPLFTMIADLPPAQTMESQLYSHIISYENPAYIGYSIENGTIIVFVIMQRSK